jgi:predicted lipoprotein
MIQQFKKRKIPKMTTKRIFTILMLGLLFWACDTEGEEPAPQQDSFDRAAMLANWADNIIIPAYQAYVSRLDDLTEAKNAFLTESSEANFSQLRDRWLDAYTAWQQVSMFEIGKAEQLTLRDYTNIFPTDANKIESYLSGADYKLELPSARSQQGFPALDYLLFGSADTDAAVLARFNESEDMRAYLDQLVTRLNNLATQVLDDWENGYRNTFVSNSGSEASSSVNKMLNDYMFYYEKALRAGKVGIPAGVFSNTPLSDRVEALYAGNASKVLFETALDATVDFFNGVHFDGSGSGAGLADYLAFLNTISGGERLDAMINNQFDKAKSAANPLPDNFFEVVENDNLALLQLYDELQANVVLMKVDMFQALNVKVDFVDADGD